eukprot:tig00020710_g13268.t1
MEGGTGIGALPSDVLALILAQLSVVERRSASCVSQSWRRAAWADGVRVLVSSERLRPRAAYSYQREPYDTGRLSAILTGRSAVRVARVVCDASCGAAELRIVLRLMGRDSAEAAPAEALSFEHRSTGASQDYVEAACALAARFPAAKVGVDITLLGELALCRRRGRMPPGVLFPGRAFEVRGELGPEGAAGLSLRQLGTSVAALAPALATLEGFCIDFGRTHIAAEDAARNWLPPLNARLGRLELRAPSGRAGDGGGSGGEDDGAEGGPRPPPLMPLACRLARTGPRELRLYGVSGASAAWAASVLSAGAGPALVALELEACPCALPTLARALAAGPSPRPPPLRSALVSIVDCRAPCCAAPSAESESDQAVSALLAALRARGPPLRALSVYYSRAPAVAPVAASCLGTPRPGSPPPRTLVSDYSIHARWAQADPSDSDALGP